MRYCYDIHACFKTCVSSEEVQQLQGQQRSFFDELLVQQEAHEAALRSHCDAAVAQQEKAVELLRQQQRRIQQIQARRFQERSVSYTIYIYVCIS